MPKRSTAATVITALALSACSGGSDAAGTTDPPSATGANTTVADEPNPPEPRVTESTTTTSLAAELPTATTEPAPTTTEPSVEDQVRAAAIRTYEEYWTCLRAPEECDPGQSNLPGSDAFNAQTRTNEELVASGLYVGDEDPGYMIIESVDVRDDHTAVTSCWRLTAVLYFQPPIEGQPATVQNDSTGYSRQIDEFVQDPDGAAWKIRRSDLIEQESNVNNCPSEDS